MKRILCYGDSDTWGYVAGKGTRYGADVRWPMVAAKDLGKDYEVVENGINGRTSAFDSPLRGEFVNGVKGVPYALFAAKPVDLVVLMLGTNDLMRETIYSALKGMEALILRFLNAEAVCYVSAKGQAAIYPDGARLLLISPPNLGKGLSCANNPVLRENLASFAYYKEGVKALAEKYSLPFMDATDYTETSEVDSLHITADSHKRLGHAVAEKIKTLI